MTEHDRIAAQIAAEPRLNKYSYTLNEMPEGAFRATFYIDYEEYCKIIDACRFKPPVDCEVIYKMDLDEEFDKLENEND